jgi:FKBP-type peptidyl-prolyl cis-trans isomerase SlyD
MFKILEFGYTSFHKYLPAKIEHCSSDFLSTYVKVLKKNRTCANNIFNMQISKHKVASIHYTLTDNDGKILDTSSGREPLTYIQGIGNLIPGMEEGLDGKSEGDKVKIKVSPEKGYGVKDDSLQQKVPRASFGTQEIKVGMQFQTNQGGVVTVTSVGLAEVTVDANHPLAGVELNFDVEVMAIRSATEEEIAHGHVHGPGGHHH